MVRDLDHDRPVAVAVRPGEALNARPRLFAALEAAFPVSFEPANGSLTGCDAAIVLCDHPGVPAGPELARGIPMLALGARPHGDDAVEAVKLHDHDHVDGRVRGIELLDPLDGPALAAAGDAEHVLASAASGAAWTVTRAAPPVHRVRSALPELAPDKVLRDLLADRGLPLVALVHFLRELTDASSLNEPPLRAVLLFDDPNLRWRTYGFIDYARLLGHADEHGYHASMAMIPLDGWRSHRATVDLFRARADRLSLVFHGNDHVRAELMRPARDTDALEIAAQAMRRIARFESRHGLHVERVMTPPHGMCSERTAYALGTVGFDALCAAHPLPWTERPPGDRVLAGWEPATFAGGCAVIPRIPFTTSSTELALRAFLGQPLVLYGHHTDLADGLDLLAETAARVNRLGDVRWTSVGAIATTNCALRVGRHVARVRPYSRRLELRLPEAPSRLIVEAPRDRGHSLVGWSAGEDGSPHAFGTPVPEIRGDAQILLRGAAEVDPASVPRSWRPWPVVRRLATEARDRAVALRATAGCLVVALAAESRTEWLSGPL